MLKIIIVIIPFWQTPRSTGGGTGFFYEQSPRLPEDIEHHMPDYHLYDEWVEQCICNGAKPKEFVYYKDYSIGFLTRGCFRQCSFCVNKVYKKCTKHSPLCEFYDANRKKLCFLDDNFFACSDWSAIINEVKLTRKRFQFKQGLDERLLTEDKIQEMNTWKYDGDFIFAFDNIEDKELIISKLETLYKIFPNWNHQMKFYCFCGFDRNDKYDEKFWLQDIKDLFERIFLLSKYSVFPYVMRHENYQLSPYADIYIYIASWVNQPAIFRKFTLKEYCQCHGMNAQGYAKYKRDITGYLREFSKKYASWRYYDKFMEMTNNLFESEVNTLPISLTKMGRWL